MPIVMSGAECGRLVLRIQAAEGGVQDKVEPHDENADIAVLYLFRCLYFPLYGSKAVA